MRHMQIYKGDRRPRIGPVLKLEFFADHICKNKCAQDLCMLCSILHVFIFTFRLQLMQVAYTPDKPQLQCILITGKTPEDLQFEPHAGTKMVRVLGSPLYICDSVT